MAFALSDMRLSSCSFDRDMTIPIRHTGEGKDISPPLAWRDPPEATQNFAVLCHDPDAPLISPNGTYGFVHWVLYNIPPTVSGLDEGTREYISGRNDFDRQGYRGPMPPAGHGRRRQPGNHVQYQSYIASNRLQ